VDSCGTNYTFAMNGTASNRVGSGDIHNHKYDVMEMFVPLNLTITHEDALTHCYHNLHIYPSQSYELTSQAFHYAVAIVFAYTCTGIVFLIYDWFVTTRQTNTERKARQTNAIVQELFPGNVAAKLYETKEVGADEGRKVLGTGTANRSAKDTIAELYPAATVLCKCYG
jgi:hypothetical protein